MYVSPETLELHITELKRRFELVHLDEWLRRARRGLALTEYSPAPSRSMMVGGTTASSGCRVLVKHNAPATIFSFVSSYVGTAQQFWPNRLMSLLDKAFAGPGSVRLSGTVEGHHRTYPRAR